RPVALAAEPLVEQAPLGAPWRGAIGRALPVIAVQAPPARLRRCVHRKLSPTGRRDATTAYSAECLYEGVERATPLGNLDAARRACEACTNTGLWRADED